MANSENGWPQDPKVVRIYVGDDVDGCEVRVGDVRIVLEWFMQQFHEKVETLTQANGFRTVIFNNSLAGSIRNSNHTSGTAVDLNGAKHPNQAVHPGATSGFTVKQTATIRALMKKVGVIEWGADFASGKKDFMHFAIAKGTTAAEVRAAAKKITPKPPEEPVTVVKSGPNLKVPSGTAGQKVGTVIRDSGKTAWTNIDFDPDAKKTVNTIVTSKQAPRGGLIDLKGSLANVPIGATVQVRVYRVDTDSKGKTPDGIKPVTYEIVERDGTDGETKFDLTQTFGKSSPNKPATETRFRTQVQVILPPGSTAKPEIRAARAIISVY